MSTWTVERRELNGTDEHEMRKEHSFLAHGG